MSSSSSSIDCDADKDGYSVEACGGPGPFDCNDHDPNVNPGVGNNWIQAVPTPYAGWLTGDWNCDNKVEMEFTTGDVMCTSVAVNTLLNPAACASISGYTQAPPSCGESATFDTCAAPLAILGAVCSLGSATIQTQGCR